MTRLLPLIYQDCAGFFCCAPDLVVVDTEPPYVGKERIRLPLFKVPVAASLSPTVDEFGAALSAIVVTAHTFIWNGGYGSRCLHVSMTLLQPVSHYASLLTWLARGIEGEPAPESWWPKNEIPRVEIAWR